ncbi:MAG: heme-dependent oxidative N-demethylase family protein [Paracoccaceae bacterium]
MKPVLQTSLPYDISTDPRLPGVQPVGSADVLIQDEAFAGQLVERERLLNEHRDTVLQLQDNARPAAVELLHFVLDLHYPDREDDSDVLRPDGVRVHIDLDDPLDSLGRIAQQDFCILQKQGDEHVLTGAVLCFPASWSLAQKFGRPLVRIHKPVSSYDDGMAKRVQRLFDGVQADRPLWRFNALPYSDPSLHLPRTEEDRRSDRKDPTTDYVRSERQVIVRLPQTQAVVFCIHTFIVRREDA